MKKKILPLILLLCLATALPLLAMLIDSNKSLTINKDNGDNNGNGNSKGKIVVSINPIYSLVSNIVGDDENIELLITPKISPHNFQAKPSDIRKIRDADILFYIDDRLEISLADMLKSTSGDIKPIALAKQKDIKLLHISESSISTNFKSHDHDEHNDHDNEHSDHDDEHHHHVNSHDHDHDHVDTEGHHLKGDLDMHIWLSPDNAVAMAKVIAAELAILYPENKQKYEQNLQLLINKIKEQDADIMQKISNNNLGNIPYLTFHNAYSYFTDHYAINNGFNLDLHTKKALSGKSLKVIKNVIQQENIGCIFSDPHIGKEILPNLTDDNLSYYILDPVGNILPDATPPSKRYFMIMQNISDVMVECLGG